MPESRRRQEPDRPDNRPSPAEERVRWATSEPLPAASPENLLDRTIVGSGPSMLRLKSLLPRVARSKSNVLVQGESGTGKELIARAIHMLSPRSPGPFVAENCAALPEGVVESELFGHVRGAFTGADRDREGLLAMADGGTFFLDEVGDLPRRIQAKLLRVIQEGAFRPVGGRTARKSDFRLVSATHRDLPAMVEDGEFRQDLYYRLNVIRIQAPPLRDRAEDIPNLIDHTLRRLAEGERPVGVSREALEMLLHYDWPGNVRELENVIEAGLVMASGNVIGVAELPERILDHALAEPRSAEDAGYGKSGERVMLELALGKFDGDKAKAARYMGWSRPKLYRVMARLGIPRDFGR